MRRAGCRFAIAIAWLLLVVSTTCASTGEVQPIALSAPSGSDTASSLPASQNHFDVGATFYVEIWAQTTHSNGLSSVSLDLTYEANLANAMTITHSSLFSALTNGSIDNGAGIINDLSGSHLGPCTDAVGVAPAWARMAVIKMTAISRGFLVLASAPTGSPIYGTSICGIGDIDPAQIAFGEYTLALGNVPAMSEWGLTIFALALTVAGSVLLRIRCVGTRKITLFT